MSDEGCPEFKAAREAIEQAYRDGLKAFADWCVVHWQMEVGEDKWHNADDYPGDGFIEAYNAGINSVPDGLAAFLEDMGY